MRKRTRVDLCDDARDCDDRDGDGRGGCPDRLPLPLVPPGPTSPRGPDVPALGAGPGPRCNNRIIRMIKPSSKNCFSK